MIKVIYPIKMYGEYADGYKKFVNGLNEEDCMYFLLDAVDIHGELQYYTLFNGIDDFTHAEYIDGQYIEKQITNARPAGGSKPRKSKKKDANPA